ncbi:MAG: hypothetical protein V4718_04365 [Pseudomonadota bacterium]
MNRERVDALIERVMEQYPVNVHTRAAGHLRYYEAVHQELAPLARALEAEVDRLTAALATATNELGEAEKKVRAMHIWSCGKCGNVYREGHKDVTVFAENGHVYCRVCVKPARTWACAPMTEQKEPAT